MMNRDFMGGNEKAISSFSMRDVLAIGFRHKRIATLCFFGILVGSVFAAILQPAQYRATTKFLVDRERQDPVVSPEQNAPVLMNNQVSEEEMNSEMELLQSQDVLRQVVISCGLDKHKSLKEYVLGALPPDQKIAKAVTRLQSTLQIEPIKKSNLISVTYTSDNPQLSARVLQTLGDAYIEKHVSVHTPPGQVQFFDQEAERYQKNLGDAEAALKSFSEQQNGVAPTMSRDITLQKLSEFRGLLQQTQADLASTDQRIQMLEKQAKSTPERLTTSMRQQDDFQVLQGLKNTLMTLQLKRTELLTKYQPDYPLVKEVDKQIADTEASISAEEAKPIKEETTDRNPTYSWINEELAKARAEASALQARKTAQEATVQKYEDQARDLEQKGLTEQDLMRNVKTNEENYLLYQRKREQARMTEALDRTRIVNVAIAEQPVAPSLPSNSPLLVVLLGFFLATAATLGVVFIREYMDPSFRTPAEVADELNIPVLASVPQSYTDLRATGTDSGYAPSIPVPSTVGEGSGN